MSTCVVMILACAIVTAFAAAGAESEDIVIDVPDDVAVTHTGDFRAGECGYVLGEKYLYASAAVAGAAPGGIRVKAPHGTYYVYLAWARHPQAAQDVRVRVKDVGVELDQTRLACKVSPDDFQRDSMGYYRGICSSGLYRIGDAPFEFREGDEVQIVRSDSRSKTLTTLDYVVFSRNLYLDDLGSKAQPGGGVVHSDGPSDLFLTSQLR